MKISVVAPSEIPALRANTMQVMKMAEALTRLGNTVHLIAPGSGSKTGTSWSYLAKHYGLQNEFPLLWLKANPRLRRYDFSARAIMWTKQWKADLLYTRLPQVAALSSIMGMATIYEAHDLPQGLVGPWLFQLFARGKGAKRLVVITRALRDDLVSTFKIRREAPFTIIAPDGIDLARYTNMPTPSQARDILGQGSFEQPKIPIPSEHFTVGYTGHLYKGRGIDLLLDLADNLPEVNFLIAGGEERDVIYWKTEAINRNLENVFFTGFVPNSVLPLYQAACDILLMPYQRKVAASSGGDISHYLSPMKLFEYLACQRPIVSSDLPVLQEILNAHNAILVPCNDLNAWISAIQRLKKDDKLRENLAVQARHDANRYTWEDRARKILEYR